MNLVDRTIVFVKSELSGAEGGHDWWHVHRVLELSRTIAGKEHADTLVCELGALLHDIADPKFHGGDEKKGAFIALNFLRQNSVTEKQTHSVLEIVENISFSKSLENIKIKSLELQVVQDADRLDAMGAIGIARAFNYGGFKNRLMYNPSIPPKKYNNSIEYRNSNAPTINHFHEKLLLLKDLMNTKTAMRMADERHKYMLGFLKQFHEEWEGKK
jgi:uncharacterized protein